MVNTRMKRYGSQTNTKKCLPNAPKEGKYVTCESKNETQQVPVMPVDTATATLVTTSVAASQEQLFPAETRSQTAADSADEKLMTNDDNNMELVTESGRKLRKVENMHVGMEQDESEKDMNMADSEISKEIQEAGIEDDDTATRRLNPELSDSKDKTRPKSVTSFFGPEVITLDEDDGVEIIEGSNEAYSNSNSFRNETESGTQDEINKETVNEIRRVTDGYHQSHIEEAEDEKISQTVPGAGSSESCDNLIINPTDISTEKMSNEESDAKVSVNVSAEGEKLFTSTLTTLKTGSCFKQSVTTSVPQKGQQRNKKPMVLPGAEITRNIPRGITIAGKVWKGERRKFSKSIKCRGLKLSYEESKKLSAELKRVKELSRARQAEIQKEKERKKERIAKARKMREKNAKKAELVQVITNTAKLKRMTKKQLKNIEKRDTTKVCRV